MHVLVLVGVPGAGKTSLSKRLKNSGWLHINQDELGNRRACEDAFRAALRRDQHVVVDRCNIDESQRAHWVRLAHEVRPGGVTLLALQLLLPLELCKERVRDRADHPTLGPHNCDEVIDRFAREFVQVRPREGFPRILTAHNSQQADAAAEQLVAEAGPSPEAPRLEPFLDPYSQPYDDNSSSYRQSYTDSYYHQQQQQHRQPRPCYKQQQYQYQYQYQEHQHQQQYQYQYQEHQHQQQYQYQQRRYEDTHLRGEAWQEPGSDGLGAHAQGPPRSPHRSEPRAPYYHQRHNRARYHQPPSPAPREGLQPPPPLLVSQPLQAPLPEPQPPQEAVPAIPVLVQQGWAPPQQQHHHHHHHQQQQQQEYGRGTGIDPWKQPPPRQQQQQQPEQQPAGLEPQPAAAAAVVVAGPQRIAEPPAGGVEAPVAGFPEEGPGSPRRGGQRRGHERDPGILIPGGDQELGQRHGSGGGHHVKGGWEGQNARGGGPGTSGYGGRGRGARGGGGGGGWESHRDVVDRLRASFADPRSPTPYDALPVGPEAGAAAPPPPPDGITAADANVMDADASAVAAGSSADPRVILLFDLNGTLTSHTSVRRAQGVTRLRPGTEHLVALKRHFRLGIYTSSTVRTVQTAMEQLEGAAGEPLFERRLVLHREHTTPAPQGHVDLGGDPWDTLKPLGRYFSSLHRVVLVDDDAYKSIKGEELNMLVVPCWRDEDASCCLLRLLSELLITMVAALPQDTDVRTWTGRVSAHLHARAAAAAATGAAAMAAGPPGDRAAAGAVISGGAAGGGVITAEMAGSVVPGAGPADPAEIDLDG